MSQTQGLEAKGEAIKKLVSNIEELVKKLENMPDNEELKRKAQRMYNIAKDIRTIAENRFDRNSDFDGFVLVINWASGIRVFTPESKVEVTYISCQCLDKKTIYECLKEEFADKTPILNELFEALSTTLEAYMDTLYNTLYPQKEEDP
jgi:hypothetical protein